MKQRDAFSLVELVVVVLILAVLATIVVPRITESAQGAKDAKCQSNVANLIRALELRAANNDGDYPANQSEFNSEVLNNTTYFPHGAPTCPNSGTYTYDDVNETVTCSAGCGS
jgi:prepilin-type N-terminal cleavage/methylation domain-containing protein